MQSIYDQGPPPPCPTPFNLAAYVLGKADALGEKTALEVIGNRAAEKWSYSDLHRIIAATATGFQQAGLHPGDRLLIRLGNRVEFPVAYLAAILIDVIPVPTSAQLTGAEITKIADATQPKAIVAEDGIALPDPQTYPVINLNALRDMQTLLPAAPVMGDPDRLAYIVFTSGTSDMPRGVRHAHRAIWARRMMFEAWYGLHQDDRLMHAGAFNWTYTMGTGLMDPWTMGATALIPMPDVTSAELPELIKTHKATIFAAAPGVYRQILNAHDTLDLPDLRHGLSAGEALPEALRVRWQKAAGCDLHQALGMSECSTFISGSPDNPAGQGNSGKPQPGRRVAVLENGVAVPHDTPGTLAVSTRDPGLMLGYLGQPDVDGDWFETGDTVSMSVDGQITYLGRSDDMLNAGGYRVSPLEVEAAFATCPGLQDCACTQVKVKADTFVIALFYVGSESMDEQVMRAHAHKLLAKYKHPRLYIALDALPKGGNGKLNRRALRTLFEARP